MPPSYSWVALPALEESVIDQLPLTVAPHTIVADAIRALCNSGNVQIQPFGTLLNHAPHFPSTSQPTSQLISRSQFESCILVVEADQRDPARQQLVGIFTEHDVVQLIAKGVDLSKLTIADVMSPDVVTLTLPSTCLTQIHSAQTLPTQTLLTALSLLRQHQIRHLPVLDEQGNLIGVTTLDRLSAVLQDQFAARIAQSATSEPHELEQTRPQLAIRAGRNPAETVNQSIPALQDSEMLPHQQTDPENLVAHIAQRIRQSLNLDEILQTTVDEVRQVLQTDRVLLFRFTPDWRGTIAVESVGEEWTAILSTKIYDPCLSEQYVEPYRQGRVSAIADIHAADVTPCYADLLSQFQVRANLVVPILQGETLWGLLIAHHCSDVRSWELSEIELLKHIATQVSIAIQQAGLYHQVQTELIERQQTEAALRESEARFRMMADTAPVLIWLSDVEKARIYFNRVWMELTGRSLEQELGDGWVMSVHADDRVDCFETYTTAFDARQSFRMEYRLRRSDGEYRWILDEGTPRFAPDGEFLGYIGSCVDITDRKLAEQTIREQATLIDVATNAIYVCNLDYQLTFWNKGAERLYGWTGEEALHQDVTQFLHRSSSQALDLAHTTVFQQGEWQGELSKVTKSGKSVITESRWTLVRNEAEHPVSILMVDTDITEKKDLEAQFLRTQRLESLGTLASGIAHDLNNILTPILAIAQLLPMKLSDLDEPTRSLLVMLETNSKRGANLVKQVLSFARGIEGERTILQLRHLLRDVQQMMRQTFPKSVEVDLTLPQDLWVVSGDATQLHQVFLNLAVNARDAMPEGGKLHVTAENRVIDEQYARMHLDAIVGTFSVVTFSDTGVGILPEVLDHIFEPFFTTKELGKGTGLGLSTVIGIVKSHGGFVEVSSVVGKGTQFRIFLPALIGSEAPPTQALETSDGQGELILLVDDETAIREVLKATLEAHQYQVMTARDGIDAIALYAQHQAKIRAVVMDIMMPSMDGITAIRTLQRLNPQVKIIALSGLSTNEAQTQAAGVKTFLPKPCTSEDLLIAVRQVLSSSLGS
ncbi:MAG: PAS domain S-box protein [Myxacorys californica WJT36-NPBG1]|jgi:PAS domain S-box-containing protein|nr:PAS domain S-box protein [Myxacorys californica WJT36-NPBG1]